MDFVEREAELDALDVALGEAVGGRGSVVLVAGEAGIGKTLLVRSFSAGHAEDVTILWGGCDDLSTPRTLGPFHDIAIQVGGELRDALAAGEPRSSIFDAVYEAFDRGMRPIVAVIEDVHWADGATLDVLKFLGRRIDRLSTLLILTYRSDEVGTDHPLAATVGDLPAAAVRRLDLNPLSRAGVAGLASGFGGSIDELFAATRGNPFLVAEVLTTPGDDVPANVRDAVSARAARLSPAARDIADFVAVVPSQTERWLLDRLPGFDRHALDECRERGLLGFDDVAAWYRHELVRGAMEEALSPRRRRELNALALAVLIERDADVARIVHHARRAEDPEAIVRFAPRAARLASAATAHREAVAHFRLAVDQAYRLPEPERAELLVEYAVECYFTNEAGEGLAAAERALALWRELGDVTGEGRTLRWLSRLHWWLGHGEMAEQTGVAAIEVLETVEPSEELARAYSNLGQVFMLAQRPEPADRWAEKAIALARELEDADTLAHSLNNLGSSRVRVGDTSGMELLEESLDISVLEGLGDHAGRAYANIIWTALDYRDYATASRYLEEGLAFANKHELGGSIYYLTAERSRMHLDTGEWASAEEDAAWVLARPEEPGITRMPALAILARLKTRRGDSDAADAVDEAWRMAEPTGELQRMAPALLAAAEWSWLNGGGLGISATVGDAYRQAVAARQPWVTDELAFWTWRSGEPVEAPPPSDSPFALHMSGRWEEAAAAWETIGCPYERALALADAPDEASLLQSLDLLDGLGAAPAAAMVRSRLRDVGAVRVPRGPRRRTRSHPAGLTPRQAEVLALVVEGRTNAEIADSLFISPKTVDHHVSALLTKLGVSTRTEAAQVAIDLGVVE